MTVMRPLLLLIATLCAVCLTSVDSRLVRPQDLSIQAFRQRRHDYQLQQRIDSYYRDGAFPKAGRSLKDKIREAERFLAEQIPQSGIVGVGAAVVYEDQVVIANGYGLRSSSVSDSKVTSDSMFQIGSVTKTMIAVAIGLLVEDNKLQWNDAVKTHLPWLKLFDKYAEQYLTIGDLLAMNSGLGGLPNIADFLGEFPTEREYVEALEFCKPEHSLRQTPEYANVNFVILGQVFESVSGLAWDRFLQERLWTPLGMNHTYASALQVPEELRPQILNEGHFACAGEVLGPYDVATAPSMQISPGREGGLNAAGSVVSSTSDMAIFLRLLLNKGKVGNVTLLKSPSTITEIVTGHVLASSEILEMFSRMGLHYEPEGAMLAAGYGIDIVGNVLWGHAYYDKSGDVAAHQTRTGFAPLQNLAVIFMGNTQVPEAHATYYLDHYRTYVLGIFLDVPKHILDFEFKKWRAADQLQPEFPGAPVCGLRFWKNPPRTVLSTDDASALVGTYVATESSQFYPNFTISRIGDSTEVFTVQIAQVGGKLVSVGELDGATLFVTNDGPMPLVLPASRDTPDGSFVFDLGLKYRKL